MAAKAGGNPRRVAAVTGHALIAVSQGIDRVIGSRSPGLAVIAYRLGEARLFVVVGIARRDAVQHLFYFPLFVRLQHGALKQPALGPIKAPISPWSAEQLEVCAASGRCGSRGSQVRSRLNATVTINAVDLNGIARLSVKASIPVIVL